VLTVSTGSLLWIPGTAAAHTSQAASGVGIAPVAVVAGVPTVGLLTGVGATLGSHDWGGQRVRSHRIAGPLLVGLGLLAILPGLGQLSTGTLLGSVAGMASAGAVRSLGSPQRCVGATVGTLGIHRVLEGAGIAALFAGDATVTTVAAIAVAAHACVESLVIGGHPQLSARQKRRSVLGVQAAFLAGVALQMLVFDTAGAGTPWLSAALGGVLVVFGSAITRAERTGGPAC